MLFLESGLTIIDVVTSAPKEADVRAGQRICTPLYALLARRPTIWSYVSNPQSGGASPGPMILSNTAHARRSSWMVSGTSIARSRAWKGACRQPIQWGCTSATRTLSSGDNGYTLEVGVRDPKPTLHLSHPCADGTGLMPTLAPSTETFWVYVPRVGSEHVLGGSSRVYEGA